MSVPPAFVPPQLLNRPFTVGQARAAGLTDRQLQSRPWQPVTYGVWAHESLALTRKVRVAAAALVLGPYEFLCGPTAAWLGGIDVARRADDPDEPMWVGYLPGHRVRKRKGWRLKQVAVTATDLTVRDGARLTAPLRTAFDCSRWLALTEAVMVVDALANRGTISFEELAAYAAKQPVRYGSPRLADVLAVADAGAESPMETRTRLVIAPVGLALKTQVWVFDIDGRVVGRLDMADELLKIGIEYDGVWHQEQRQQDDRRRDALRHLGWEIIVVGWTDLYLDGGVALVERVRRVADRRRRRLGLRASA